MKKVFNFKSLAMIIAMISAMSMVSCVQEPTANQQGSNTPTTDTIVSATVAFDTQIKEGTIKLYDIVATITIDKETIETPITDSTWTYEKTFTKDIPSKVSCKIVGTLKNPLPEITEESLKMGSNNHSHVSVVRSNNKETSLSPSVSSSDISGTITIGKDKIEEYISKYPTKNIMTAEYEIK